MSAPFVTAGNSRERLYRSWTFFEGNFSSLLMTINHKFIMAKEDFFLRYLEIGDKGLTKDPFEIFFQYLAHFLFYWTWVFVLTLSISFCGVVSADLLSYLVAAICVITQGEMERVGDTLGSERLGCLIHFSNSLHDDCDGADIFEDDDNTSRRGDPSRNPCRDSNPVLRQADTLENIYIPPPPPHLSIYLTPS